MFVRTWRGAAARVGRLVVVVRWALVSDSKMVRFQAEQYVDAKREREWRTKGARAEQAVCVEHWARVACVAGSASVSVGGEPVKEEGAGEECRGSEGWRWWRRGNK